ncbi:uncharacterized protein LOC126378194 [Pectinophora gossypiella]|uniref:uncharacterized protein LOC126378194 n=1 Tax=Pectinophora gossypiella TaxID=13191 RepID=UPI00214E04E2|nr:uncharacterized protein LOC126378194 [Pectinophora gossypiella]
MLFIFSVFLNSCMMVLGNFENITLNDFRWVNEPSEWSLRDNALEVTTDNNTDFWQKTYYDFHRNTGHIFGVEIVDDFTFTACIEANFTTLYDQAGLMIYVDEKHWLKAGIEYNDGLPMIGSVNTNEVSDWGTGVFTGNPRKFYLRLSKVDKVVCVKYSTDNVTWTLLCLAPFAKADKYIVGPMTCTPQREGLKVKFSDIKITEPADDILHAN